MEPTGAVGLAVRLSRQPQDLARHDAAGTAELPVTETYTMHPMHRQQLRVVNSADGSGDPG